MKHLLLVTLLVFSIYSQAQRSSIFKGVGVFGALTQSAQYYNNKEDKQKADSPYVYTGIYPPSHVSKEFFNWGAGVFLELSARDNVRWQTELEYTHTGAKEKELLNPATGERNGSYTKNKLTYIEWNNYLKFYNPIGYAHWYVMPGIRLQYQLNSKVSAFTAYSGDFPKFWFSGDIGLGYEFPLFKKYSAFAEYHWNPDIIPHKKDDTSIRSRTFELRVGIVMRPRKRAIDDCNAPVYKGPTY